MAADCQLGLAVEQLIAKFEQFLAKGESSFLWPIKNEEGGEIFSPFPNSYSDFKTEREKTR